MAKVTTDIVRRGSALNINSSTSNAQNAIVPDEIAHITLYPGETRMETVKLHTTHSMNTLAVSADAAITADSTEETHIRVTLHQYAEHITHNIKNSTNKVTHKTTSNIVLDYTGPLQSTDTVNTTSNAPTTATSGINACSLQSHLHQLSPLPESHTNTPNSVSSLLTQLTLAFHHHSTVNTTVKYVDIEIEVCNAPASVFKCIELLKQDTITNNNALNEVDPELNLTLYSRVHRLRVYLHYVPGLTATSISTLHTSTRMPVPSYLVQGVQTSLQTLLQQNKLSVTMKSNTSGNELGDVTVSDNTVRLLPHEMGVVLEVCVFTFIFLFVCLCNVFALMGKWRYAFIFVCCHIIYTYCFLFPLVGAQ